MEKTETRTTHPCIWFRSTKVCGLYVNTLLNWTLTSEWCMTKLLVVKCTCVTMTLDCAQNIHSFRFNSQQTWRIYAIAYRERKYTLTSYNFCISTPNPETCNENLSDSPLLTACDAYWSNRMANAKYVYGVGSVHNRATYIKVFFYLESEWHGRPGLRHWHVPKGVQGHGPQKFERLYHFSTSQLASLRHWQQSNGFRAHRPWPSRPCSHLSHSSCPGCCGP